MISMLDDDFEYFYQRAGFGPRLDAMSPSQNQIESYRRKLPSKLLSYWDTYGFAGYGQGLFWMTDPDEYAEVLNAWIYGTRFYRQDEYSVVGRTAFGKLMVWGRRTGFSLSIDCPWGMIFPSDKSRWMNEGEGDLLISNWLAGMQMDSLDQADEKDALLFDRAEKALGPLANDEMYGFVPALAAGGHRRLDSLKRVKAVERLMFLAQLGKPEEMIDIVKEAKDRGLWK
jgi:hypothetical protein